MPGDPWKALISGNGKTEAWDLKDKCKMFDIGCEAKAFDFQPLDSGMVALAQGDKWTLYDLQEGVEITSVSTSDPLTCIKFHPDGLIISTGHTSGDVKLWDIRTESIIQTLHGEEPVRSITFSNKGYHLAAGWESCVKLFDMRKGFAATDIAFEGAKSLGFDEFGSYLMVSDGSKIWLYAGKQWG